MKKILKSQKGVTLIETLAASVIVILLLLTVMGALMFGGGVIVGSDEKNNAAASAQEILDALMVSMSNDETYTSELIADAKNMGAAFNDDQKTMYPKQYYIVPVDKNGNEVASGSQTAYQIYVRVYYNQGQSYVDLTAFNKKGGVWE
ncbi:type II secretion system protein [Eubacteriaceae bacterium ES3]|nr:type II secretion system protein [Eubacteriaceae bacterium ES3]